MVYIPLTEIEKKALWRLAQAERRDARHQGALLIRRELERLGLLEPARPAVVGDGGRAQSSGV